MLGDQSAMLASSRGTTDRASDPACSLWTGLHSGANDAKLPMRLLRSSLRMTGVVIVSNPLIDAIIDYKLSGS